MELSTRHMFLTIVASTLLSVLASLAIVYGHPTAAQVSSLSTTEIQQDHLSSVPAGSAEEAIVTAVKKAEPAVVSVIISKDMPVMEQRIRRIDPFGNGGFFEIPEMQQNGTEKREIGGGTAFFISPDGLLLTNKHVVSDEKAEYTVLLNDGKKLPATVLARDPVNDIALIKVEGSNYPYLALSSQDVPSLGQTAIAIGNALGEYRNTVSIGAISGLERSITAGDETGQTEQLNNIIQTDAAINRGNSGGPLISSQGEVIGMNTATAGGAQNISFAIPAGDLRRVVESYQKHGKIVRPFMGVRYAAVTEEMKEKNKLPYDYGMLIVRGESRDDLAVMPGSPADKAGLTENDIILEADGQKLSIENPLSAIVSRKQPGEELKLKVFHQGNEKTVTVILGEWKE